MSLNTKYDILDNRLVIRRLNAGDRQCFEACYRFYYKGLCSFASRWVSLPVAEDIVQDTMLYIWENRDRLMEELSLKGLLFMIVRNKSLDRISSQKVHSRVHQQLEKRFADQFDSPDFYLGTELARLYREALAQLPEQTRRIFEMSRFQGMTHQQIAAEMEVSPQTVNYHIGQALKVPGTTETPAPCNRPYAIKTKARKKIGFSFSNYFPKTVLLLETELMKEIDDNLLTEFLEGKLDEPANREIENWYDASEENRRRLEALYFVLFAGDRLRAAASVNTDQAFRSLQRRIELRRTKTRPQWRQIAARYAAILVAGVIVAGMYLYQNRPDDRICTVSAERSDCSVTLPDGSVIRLTRSSQLNYPASFDDGNRTVHLTGEAFFEVSKRNGAPFTVTTVHDAEVVVRGTKFNLKAYDDSSDVETVLVEGAVDFRAADHVVALHPGQKVSYNPTDNDLTLQTVNVEAELAARLRTFRHVDLAQIAGVIEDFYGIGVAFRSEALKNIQFTGTLDFNMPIDHILEVLTLSTNTRFNRNGEKITIHK